MNYKFYVDPGHGWLAVKRSEVIALGLSERISVYSYQRGNTVYLEEDCDLARFLIAKGMKMFSEINAEEKYSDNSPIRSYDRYKAEG
jgi:hypothetical protein